MGGMSHDLWGILASLPPNAEKPGVIMYQRSRTVDDHAKNGSAAESAAQTDYVIEPDDLTDGPSPVNADAVQSAR
jgi:hypothetical protein